MIVFVTLVIMLLLLTCALFVLPALGYGVKPAAMSRDQLNTRFYQSRLDELAHDEREGVVSERAQHIAQGGLEQAALKVVVTLSPAAAAGLPPQGTLFISVSDGQSPIPVAVKPLPLSRFPLSLSLDDSNAMIPERLLSAQRQVKVRVRVARDVSAVTGSARVRHSHLVATAG